MTDENAPPVVVSMHTRRRSRSRSREVATTDENTALVAGSEGSHYESPSRGSNGGVPRVPLAEVATPSTPRTFAEVATPPPRVPLAELPTPPPPLPPGTADTTRATPHTQLQRFSLLSRTAVPGARPVIPGHREFRHQARVGLERVVCCCCSWEEPLNPERRRLCDRRTEEHSESELLRAMNRRFVADFEKGGPPVLADRAGRQEVEVHWLLDCQEGGAQVEVEAEDEEEEGEEDRARPPLVVGYVSITRTYRHRVAPNVPDLDRDLPRRAPARAPLLTQLFVEPGYRQRGYATAALRALLAGRDAVAVDAPTPATLHILGKLRFILVGGRDNGEGQALCLFLRASKSDENRPIGG